MRGYIYTGEKKIKKELHEGAPYPSTSLVDQVIASVLVSGILITI